MNSLPRVDPEHQRREEPDAPFEVIDDNVLVERVRTITLWSETI